MCSQCESMQVQQGQCFCKQADAVSMEGTSFHCPSCTEPTGCLLATADCSAGHALCPECACQWFSRCSRCPQCNSDVKQLHVHLLSTAITEAAPQEMKLSIQERSIETAVFEIPSQTQLHHFYTAEEMIAAIPEDSCQGEYAWRMTQRG